VLLVVLLLAGLTYESREYLRASAERTGVDTRYPAPPLTGKAAVVYDLDRQETLYSVNPNLGLPIASTTKLMTALLVLERGHLSDTTIVSYTAATIGQSSMYLNAGEVVTLRDLLYGLLLPSGNDAAIALAEAVSGSEAAFVAAMNARCRQLGCTNTHFTNPHGLDGDGNYSSAHDLLLVLLADLHYGTFRGITGTKAYSIPPTARNRAHSLVNVNEALWWYPGVVAGKPGNTTAGGFCSTLYVVRGSRHVALVILGMNDRYTDVRDVLNYAFGDFTWRSPSGINQTLRAVLFPADDLSYDSPYRYLAGSDGPGKSWRYYVGTGYYARTPFLAYYEAHPNLGLPKSQPTLSGSGLVQRFGTTLLSYNHATGVVRALPAR
jgi:D-alanyl-D-alanine carboxypeptidase